MSQPHKHAECIKAWADGKEIQYRHTTSDGWQPLPKTIWEWYEATEYRIKPEPKYPETRMTDDEIVSTYFNGGPVSLAEEYSAWRRVANAAIRRAIQDGDVVLPEGEA